MALILRKEAVVRGRADDSFAESSISVEPAPTQRDMAVAGESIGTQNRLATRLMSKMVHVALEKPYRDDPQATVVLVYGREEATAAGNDRYQDEGDGSPPVPASDRLFTQGAEFAAPLWEPGKWIHYHLRWEEGPLGTCSCGQDPETIVGREAIMPGPVARHWFGDWDVVAYELKTRQGQIIEDWLKRSWHRDRVATENWGGYEMDFPPGVPVYDAKGAINFRALRRFGPPQVPHVVIHRLDTMMRRLPNTEARPWDIFKWGDACEKGPRMHFFENKNEGGAGIVSVTADELNRMIAQGVAAALAAERAAKPPKANGQA
jgi:hypothetical protein